MSDNENELSNIAREMAKETYGDLVKPSAATIGDALGGIFKAITYYPRYWAKVLDISLDEKVARFREKLESNVSKISEENRKISHPAILGPAVQALEYALFEDDLRDMFTNLISSSMNNKFDFVHPAFVDLIKNLHPYEARFLKERFEFCNEYSIKSEERLEVYKVLILDSNSDLTYRKASLNPILVKVAKDKFTFAIFQTFFYKKVGTFGPNYGFDGYLYPDYVDIKLFTHHLSNLIRLGIFEFQEILHREGSYLTKNFYKEIKRILYHEENASKDQLDEFEFRIKFEKLKVTPFGFEFLTTCVVEGD